MTSKAEAAALAERLIGAMERRWRHTQGVARRALELGALEHVDRGVLVAAAYLHDVGYAPSLHDTGHHALDGARHVARLGWFRVASLIAYHSAALHEARLRNLEAELAEFPREASATADALTYCDLLTDADGCPTSLPERFADIERRYGPDHLVARAVRLARPELSAAVGRTEERLLETRFSGTPLGDRRGSR